LNNLYQFFQSQFSEIRVNTSLLRVIRVKKSDIILDLQISSLRKRNFVITFSSFGVII